MQLAAICVGNIQCNFNHQVKMACLLTSSKLLLLKEVGSVRLRESDVHPISPKAPAPQYQSTDRKKGKEKILEDYSRD